MYDTSLFKHTQKKKTQHTRYFPYKKKFNNNTLHIHHPTPLSLTTTTTTPHHITTTNTCLISSSKTVSSNWPKHQHQHAPCPPPPTQHEINITTTTTHWLSKDTSDISILSSITSSIRVYQYVWRDREWVQDRQRFGEIGGKNRGEERGWKEVVFLWSSMWEWWESTGISRETIFWGRFSIWESEFKKRRRDRRGRISVRLYRSLSLLQEKQQQH